jgi:hypothetical protein
MSGVLSLIVTINATVSTSTMEYFTNYGLSTFTVHLPNLITIYFLLLMRSQITTNSQMILHLKQYTYERGYHGMSLNFKGSGVVASSWTDINSVLLEYLHFKVLSVPTDKNFRD